MVIATPSAWRWPSACTVGGADGDRRRTLMLVPIVDARDRHGRRPVPGVHELYTGIPLGRPAQMLGHVTFTLSFVVVIVRGRLTAIGRQYEEAARDLGATPLQAMRLVLLPLLGAGDLRQPDGRVRDVDRRLRDLVVPVAGASNETVPIKIYSGGARPTPALNALATVMLVFTLRPSRWRHWCCAACVNGKAEARTRNWAASPQSAAEGRVLRVDHVEAAVVPFAS